MFSPARQISTRLIEVDSFGAKKVKRAFVGLWLIVFTGMDVAANQLVQTQIQTQTRSVKVVASVWQGFTELDGSGIYFNLLAEVYQESKFELEFNTSEFQRALNLFRQGKADVMVGVLKHEVPNGYFPNWILDTDLPIVGFHLKSNPIIPEQLASYQSGWMGMYGMEQFFPNITDPYLFKSRRAAFNMLVAKRLDVFLDYAHNEDVAYNDFISYATIRPSEVMYLVFQPTYKGKLLAKIYDERMAILRKNDTLKRIFGESYQRSGLIEFEVN